jgi:hypothetical protein
MDRSSDADENPLIRLQVFAYDFQNVLSVTFAGQRDVKISRFQLKQARQQFCIVDIRAMRCIEIAARAAMDPDALTLFRREPR